MEGPGGGTQDTTTVYEASNTGRKSSSKGPDIGGVGMLEAEFLLTIGILVLFLFSGTGDYATKIMSLMKRGSLACLLFVMLAFIASIGPRAGKFAKAFGALVVVGILVTSDMGTPLQDIDNLIKADWVGTGETAGDTAASADAGTGATKQPSGDLSPEQAVEEFFTDPAALGTKLNDEFKQAWDATTGDWVAGAKNVGNWVKDALGFL